MNLLNILFGYVQMILIDFPFILYLFLCTLIGCLPLLIIRFVKIRQQKWKHTITIKYFVWVFIFLFYLAGVYYVTGAGTIWNLLRSGVNLNNIHLIPDLFDLTDALNIVMAIPLGFLLPFIWPRFRSLKKVIIVGACFSLMIEISQLFTIRAAATEDLLMNILGATLGYLLFKAICHSKKEHSKLASLKYEAVLYIALSFLGVFLLYNAFFLMQITSPAPATVETTENFMSTDEMRQLLDGLEGNTENSENTEDNSEEDERLDNPPALQARRLDTDNSSAIAHVLIEVPEGMGLDELDENTRRLILGEILTGQVLDILDDGVVISRTFPALLLPDNSLFGVEPEAMDENPLIRFTNDTIFEIWETDDGGFRPPTIIAATRQNLYDYAAVEITLCQDNSEYAESVIIWRFI